MANGIDFGTAIGLIKGLGSPDPAVIESAVSDWLDDHPEATTTVQDGSITKAKLDSNLQGTVDDVADLKSALLYSYELTDNTYVSYSSGNLLSYNGLKTIIFDVSSGLKINYLYTIKNPDARGMAFYDNDGIYISGVQTKSTTQVVDVPLKAKTVKATITNIEEIKITHAIDALNSKAGGFVVSELNDIATFLNYVSIKLSDLTFENDKYVNCSTGNIGSISNRKASDYVQVMPNQIVNIIDTYSWAADASGCAFYDSNKKYISGVAYSKNVPSTNIVVPDNAYYIRFTASNSFVSTDLFNTEYNNYLYKTLKSINSKTLFVDNFKEDLLASINPYYIENPLDGISDDTGLLDMFLNVGVIGDSLASGCYETNEGTKTNYAFSWGQYLARKTGNTYFQWSAGGLSTASWLTSEYATECYDGNHLCQAYIIGLGQNDQNSGYTVGNLSDINISDYNYNEDTFAGRYGKIIQKINEINPRARIFVVTDIKPSMETAGYNSIIRGMPTLFDNVFVIDMYTYGGDVATMMNVGKRGSHYGAYGYKICAKAICSYINWIISHNLNDFLQIELIGTNYTV